MRAWLLHSRLPIDSHILDPCSHGMLELSSHRQIHLAAHACYDVFQKGILEWAVCRYVDCIANPDVRHVFEARSKVVTTLRRTLEDTEFLEVETPVRILSASAFPCSHAFSGLKSRSTARCTTSSTSQDCIMYFRKFWQVWKTFALVKPAVSEEFHF